MNPCDLEGILPSSQKESLSYVIGSITLSSAPLFEMKFVQIVYCLNFQRTLLQSPPFRSFF